MSAERSQAPQEVSLARLCYLYLWPFWMFKDASKGSLLERAAAYRHNRRQRIYLPGYVVKWTAVFVAIIGLIWLLEQLGQSHSALQSYCLALACAAGVLAAGAFQVIVVASAGYLLLQRVEFGRDDSCRGDR